MIQDTVATLQSSLFTSLWKDERMSAKAHLIFCCGCGRARTVKLVTGEAIYPKRSDLYENHYWQCPCGLYVGCHPNTIKPLGIIPTAELRKARSFIHAVLDPPWRSGRITRNALYALLSAKLGYTYHTAEIRSIAEAREVYRAAREVVATLSLK